MTSDGDAALLCTDTNTIYTWTASHRPASHRTDGYRVLCRAVHAVRRAAMTEGAGARRYRA